MSARPVATRRKRETVGKIERGLRERVTICQAQLGDIFVGVRRKGIQAPSGAYREQLRRTQPTKLVPLLLTFQNARPFQHSPERRRIGISLRQSLLNIRARFFLLACTDKCDSD